jgi:hypothetical protein
MDPASWFAEGWLVGAVGKLLRQIAESRGRPDPQCRTEAGGVGLHM